jgi:phospholipid/cholesterol/gamma-HCH transport system ATP-binding protein
MIEFKNVRKQFSGRFVLDGISGAVPEGEIAFVLGTSGTGKSVLLKCLMGLFPIDSGEIWLDKEEISKKSEQEFHLIRQKCSMVFQQPALFDSLNVFENVAFALRRLTSFTEQEIENRVRECLDCVHVEDENLWRKVQEISYGTQKRVSLARSLVLKPRVLLFDEPTTGLDPVMTRSINNLIRDLSKQLKTTSLVVSHDMNCALEIADHILFLDKGQVLQAGTPADMRSSKIPMIQEFLAEVEPALGGAHA